MIIEEWQLFTIFIIVYGVIVFWWVMKRVFEGMNESG